MNISVIGGGAAGLYTSAALTSLGHKVDLFTRQGELYGKIKSHFIENTTKKNFIASFDNLLQRKNFNLHFANLEEIKSLENKYDLFILATGTKPSKYECEGSHHILNSDEAIKWYNEDTPRTGKKIVLLGLGDVSIDIASFLLKDKRFNFSQDKASKHPQPEDVTIIGRNSLALSGFSNSRLRELLENRNFDVELEGVEKDTSSKISERRLKILKNCGEKNFQKKLKIIFNSSVLKVSKTNDRLNVHLNNGRVIDTDNVITCIGYSPVDTSILIKDVMKPIYYIGTCLNPKGTMPYIKAAAYDLAHKIHILFKGTKTNL